MTTFTKQERKAIKAICLSNASVKGSVEAEKKFASYQYWLNKCNRYAFIMNDKAVVVGGRFI